MITTLSSQRPEGEIMLRKTGLRQKRGRVKDLP